MTARAAVKVCYRCRLSKQEYNSNGYCKDCDRLRHRERLAAIKRQDEDYVKRNRQRREQEAELAQTYERVERGASPIEDQVAFFFEKVSRKPMFRGEGFLRQPNRSSRWRVA